MSEIRSILQQNKLRFTSSRSQILSIFHSKSTALSEPELEVELNGICDRVTIYRTLTTFMEKGILHKVLDDSGLTKYALCCDDCEHKHHEHVHFKCQICGQTQCLHEIPTSLPILPEGFVPETVHVLVNGVCPNCA